MSRRLIALLILTVAILTACGRNNANPAPGAPGYLIFLEGGFSNSGETVKVLDSGTGAIVRELPIGTPTADWSRYYTVTQLTGSAKLQSTDPASGRSIAQATIPAGFTLPTFGLGPTAGLSPNGMWIALTSQSKAAGGAVTTSFLVGASALSEAFKTIRVNGDFLFDALSNDGNSLYLIQKMTDPNHYRVRLYDIGNHYLMPQAVADKRDPNEPMNGIRGDSAASVAANQVFTVYVRQGGPFIHALTLGQPFAFCIDLPTKNKSDIEQQFHWALAISTDGTSLYAVNPALGTVAVMTTGDVTRIARTGTVAFNHSGDLLAGMVTSAEAKGPRIGGAALSPDGRTLYSFAETGVVAIDTATLKVRARFLDPWRPDTMRMSADGKWLYVAESSENKLWQIDPVTGAVGEVKAATNPWALLWAQPK
jgi:hypothetical protein